MYKNQKITVLGHEMKMRDLISSNTVRWVERELNAGDYNLENIPLQAGDYVVDIGANVGITSILLSKMYPGITIYAYEPLLDNYLNLLHNRWQNGAENVHCIHGAVGDQYGLIDIAVNKNNTGASSTQPGASYVVYPLFEILQQLSLRHGQPCRFVKCDCEGYEYEIFKSFYPNIEYLSMETHGPIPPPVNKIFNKYKEKIWIKKA